MRLGRHSVVLLMLLAAAGAEPVRPADGIDPAASLLQAAERRARDGDRAGAREDYEELVRQFPDSEEAPEALLRVALDLRDRSEQAIAVAERLVTGYPRTPQAAEGLLLRAELRVEAAVGGAELEQARSALEKVWILFPPQSQPRLAARSAARVLDGELALQLSLDREAMSSFLEVIEREIPSEWTARAHVGFATALIRAGEWRSAAESLQTAVDSRLTDPETRALASSRLTLLHRRFLRTGSAWRQARVLPIRGAEVRRPSGIAADDECRLLLYDARQSELLRTDPEGLVEERWPIKGAERPSWSRHGDALLPVEDALVVPNRPARYEFTTPGKTKSLDGLTAIESGLFGEWYVLTSRSTGLLAFDADRSKGTTVHPADADPIDLSADALGRIHILERKGRRVVRFDPRTNEAETLITGSWRSAEAIAVDAFGYVHVLDVDAGRIDIYDPAGQRVESLGPNLAGSIVLERPKDLAVGGDGRLYIADSRVGLVVVE